MAGERPPLPPPPPEVTDLYRAYLAAAKACADAEEQLPQPWDYLCAGEPWPTEQLAEVGRLADAQARAAVALYSHRWWQQAFDRGEAQRALSAAVQHP